MLESVESIVAHSCEILLAVPTEPLDIYALHQLVWSEVAKRQCTHHQPALLYRKTCGLVRVRVSGVPVHGGLPSQIKFQADTIVSLDIDLVLDRVAKPLSDAIAYERAHKLLSQSGMPPMSLQVTPSLAFGVKRGMRIGLCVANVSATVKITCPKSAAKAWLSGIGRGKRFGYGMPFLSR